MTDAPRADASVEPTEPAVLDYAPPQQRPWRIGAFVVGMCATIIISLGAGLIAFAMLAFSGNNSSRQEILGTFVGCGVSCICLGLGLVISYRVSRR